jgi:hypothetical protein
MAVTDAEARAALTTSNRVGGLEHWIAEQPWEAAPGGWRVLHPLHSWTFMVAPAGGGGVRLTAFMSGGSPATWIID